MSENLPVNPLAEIIKRAAANTAEGPATKLKQRWEGASGGIVAVCDCSGSMADSIGGLGLSKYEHLLVALKDARVAYPKLRIVGFSGLAREVSQPDQLPHPAGGTDLARALQLASDFHPSRTIVISDGLPDDGPAALQVAAQMTGAIDTVYCGPDAHPAIEWLRKLSRETGGVAAVWQGYRPLSETIRGLLPAPV